ncbi:MAG: histidine kinase N-terminal 7TM domain-containing protein [Anaerolineales bacterium]
MNPILSPYVLIMLVAAVICAFIAGYVWLRYRQNSETIPLTLMLAGIIEWIVATALGMLDQNLAHKMLWAKIEYIGVVSVPLLVLAYVLNHSGTPQRLTGKRLAWLAVIPAVTLILAWTNGNHGLIWAEYVPYLQNGLAYSEKTYGPVFWIYWGYSYLLLLAATVLIIRSALASKRIFRWQNSMVAIGILAPWAANILYVLHVNLTRNLDLTPLAFGITGILLATGMFQWGLFNIKPIAHAAVIAGMADGLIILDNQDRIVEGNPAAQAILGPEEQELVGKRLEQLIAGRVLLGERTRWITQKGNEIKLPHGGEIRDYELDSSSFSNREGLPEGRIVFLHDVTERKRLEERVRKAEHKQADQKIRRLNRYLRAISEANEIIVRAEEEASLLIGVCRCIVEVGGYQFAWVGFAEQDEAKSVRPAACYGVEESYLESLHISWEDNERGAGPTGTAIRSGKTAIAQNLLYQPDYEPWREQAIQHGYAASIAIPLLSEGQPLGALNIYASQPEVFDPDEVKLLEELGNDLAYGVRALRTQTAHELAEQALRASEDKFKHVFDYSVSGMSLTRISGEMEVNQTLCDMLGYTREEFLQRRWPEITHPEDVELTQNLINTLLSGEKEAVRVTKRFIHKNGSVVWGDIGTTLRRDENGQPLYLMTTINDVTEAKQAEEKLIQVARE